MFRSGFLKISKNQKICPGYPNFRPRLSLGHNLLRNRVFNGFRSVLSMLWYDFGSGSKRAGIQILNISKYICVVFVMFEAVWLRVDYDWGISWDLSIELRLPWTFYRNWNIFERVLMYESFQYSYKFEFPPKKLWWIYLDLSLQ